MSKRKKRLASERPAFLDQYRRPSDPHSDPNDRRYSREVEEKVQRMRASEFAELAESDDLAVRRVAAERALAEFLLPARRRRFQQLVVTDRGRAKLRAALAHLKDLDPRYQVRIAPSEQTPERIAELLRGTGAPSSCFVLSEKSSVDGKELPLGDALRDVVGCGAGTLVSCVAGQLGYYEGEEQGDRWILHRRAV